MTLLEYIENLNRRYKTGITTEHTFRGDLQTLIESIAPGVLATNEPVRIACGAPDFIVTKKNIPLGYIEAKDIGIDLTNKNLKEQFDRYRHSLDNLIFTDYLDFHFYKSGAFVTSIRIAKTVANKIIPLNEKLDEFTALLKDFCSYTGQSIKSSKTLAEMMAGKARMLADVIENSLNSDEENSADSSLKEQMKAFKDILIHDLSAKEFSDIYAQTVAYGMFAARLHDPSIDSFTRQEAAELIPKSNPFLRKLFGYIAGPDIDERIVWIVDALADIFRATDVAALLKNFGKATQQHDPIIHFYETFLAAYDPALRKARGVWYTPEPVVNFIVRAVNDILITDFNLPNGIADRSKTTVKVKAFTKDKGKHASAKEVVTEQEVHKVQILDPATGTGTFLSEVIKQIYEKFKGQQGIWSNYVEEHLVPRLNGFELLMASYAMAHLKLDLLLSTTGYKPKKQNRLRVYLTNSLEEYHPDTGTLFAGWLSAEANEANHIKRDTPVMVVIGNPPYSVSSSNKSEWIEKLIVDYKKGLDDNNIQPLSDDYIKFIRYGQYFIEKNGEGILAYISNNSFIDGVIHRQMRKHLLETFDKIYILDLHGSAKKNETAKDGGKDENVFDIQQGVSINIFIKNKKLTNKSKVYKSDLYGTRELKYDFLIKSTLHSVKWIELKPVGERYYFKEVDAVTNLVYQKFISLDNLFIQSGAGVQTKRDNIFVDIDKEKLIDRIKSILNKSMTEVQVKELNIQNSSSYRLLEKINTAKFDQGNLGVYNYRVFDDRFIYYDKDLLGRAFYNTMQHMLFDNVSLLTCKQQSSFDFQHSFITRQITDHNSISLQTSEASHVFPLYLYPTKQTKLGSSQIRKPNLNREIVEKIANGMEMEFTDEKENKINSFAPIDILDYVYAVLHNPTYRKKYKEFLKADFPRVPYPKNTLTFWQLVKTGGELRQIHLLESDVVNKSVTKFPVDGDNEVGRVKYENEKVWINETQYFDKVSEVAWEFYIGGYQPAQKWLKDRKGRTLNFDDIVHYQKIIVALTETERLMMEIGKIKIE